MQHECPSSEPGLDQSCVEQATKAWAEFKAKPQVFTIEMQGLIPFSESWESLDTAVDGCMLYDYTPLGKLKKKKKCPGDFHSVQSLLRLVLTQ